MSLIVHAKACQAYNNSLKASDSQPNKKKMGKQKKRKHFAGWPFPNFPLKPKFWVEPVKGSVLFLWPPQFFDNWVESVAKENFCHWILLLLLLLSLLTRVVPPLTPLLIIPPQSCHHLSQPLLGLLTKDVPPLSHFPIIFSLSHSYLPQLSFIMIILNTIPHFLWVLLAEKMKGLSL